ncbi:lytic murein transglycosylase [Pseudodesulfovibrio sp. zrk46]|uniref:lytic murein transglycosylase n=1 Tax=Pseudodesulfovibrio sp. zrk46 TaxID=2725288 RepID=UPI001FFCD8C5|nr:lytic murein transglycosylase [Pseudodesulfovibrio sp. zrk46]
MFQWTGSDFFSTKRLKRAAIVLSLAAVFICTGVLNASAQSTVWRPLVERLVADDFDRTYVESLFSRKSLEFSPEIMARKMNALLGTRLSNTKPGPPREPEVMDRYLNPILIAGAYAFYREHSGDLRAIERKYGVPGEVLTALMLVETKLGTQVGKHNALNILASMALATDYELIRPHIKHKDLSDEDVEWLKKRTTQKGNWGYGELKSLITYAQKNGQDPLVIPSSMYGAIGVCQFIPSSALSYGVDGTGDGKVDLFDKTDALYSMGNFVKRHGWKDGLSREKQLKVIYRYNHSESYALTIMAVADKLKKTKEFFGN